ncbi:hypothetical protein [Leptolyngbya sp. 7M]|uniref:hypothetical protein n=1 Tax=Leptolyngbya sp. 7M TaxID=2812896 RepID=UPI001B8C887A|nr:hypothetical protein [Leptolyngbya sp. 7M]QYO67704.1 hypothetical protein JVX88_13480 [Leptolyngbya sp. 7M]
MPTNIIQTEEDGRIFLRIEGQLLLDDAILLERIVDDIRASSDRPITIDLADLDLLDSDSAPTLLRLEMRESIDLQGLDIFLQTAIDTAERAA